MKSKADYLIFAIFLAVITVVYNVFEGLTAVYFGLEDETLALFGFGLDSFVEVISGMGIWHMVLRIQRNEDEHIMHIQIQVAQNPLNCSLYLRDSNDYPP